MIEKQQKGPLSSRLSGGPLSTLVCYEKFERIETSQFHFCFTKHDFIEKA